MSLLEDVNIADIFQRFSNLFNKDFLDKNFFQHPGTIEILKLCLWIWVVFIVIFIIIAIIFHSGAFDNLKEWFYRKI